MTLQKTQRSFVCLFVLLPYFPVNSYVNSLVGTKCNLCKQLHLICMHGVTNYKPHSLGSLRPFKRPTSNQVVCQSLAGSFYLDVQVSDVFLTSPMGG